MDSGGGEDDWGRRDGVLQDVKRGSATSGTTRCGSLIYGSVKSEMLCSHP